MQQNSAKYIEHCLTSFWPWRNWTGCCGWLNTSVI